MRLVIGDVHGCLEEWIGLESKAGFDPDRDELVVNGDLMDRGPECAEAFLRARRLRERMGNRFTYVMGNHERLLLDRKRDKDVWFWNGGKKTVESFAEAGVPLEEADSFIRENCVKLRDFGRYVVVHGGITYDDLEWNDEDECVWNRDCARGGYHGGRLLVIGHTPSMAGPYHASVDGVYRSLAGTEREPLPERGVILIDTGAVFGGDLTAFVDHLDGTFSVVSWPERKTFP